MTAKETKWPHDPISQRRYRYDSMPDGFRPTSPQVNLDVRFIGCRELYHSEKVRTFERVEEFCTVETETAIVLTEQGLSELQHLVKQPEINRHLRDELRQIKAQKEAEEEVRENNPSVKHTWENYQLLLKLA